MSGAVVAVRDGDAALGTARFLVQSEASANGVADLVDKGGDHQCNGIAGS